MSTVKRAHELEVNVSAHTLDALADELRQFADRIEREGLSTHGVCGGVEASHVYAYTHRPDITPEVWRENLWAYLKRNRRTDDGNQ